MIELKIDGDTSVYFNPHPGFEDLLLETPDGAPYPVGAKDTARNAIATVSDLAGSIGAMIGKFHAESMEKLQGTMPDEFVVKFNVGLGAKGSIVIGELSSTSGIEVAAKWTANKKA